MKYKLDQPIFLKARISRNNPATKAIKNTSLFLIQIDAKRIISKVRGRVVTLDSSKIDAKRARTIDFILKQTQSQD